MPIVQRVPIIDAKNRFYSVLPKRRSSEEPTAETDSQSALLTTIGPATVSSEEQKETETPEASDVPTSIENAPLSLHSILKNIDVGFSRDVYELEQFAREQAQADASAGLPRQDAQVLETLAVESQFKDRALSIFGEWEHRVRRRFQDGIETSCKRAGDGLVQFSHAIGKLRQSTGELERAELRLDGYEATLTAKEKTRLQAPN